MSVTFSIVETNAKPLYPNGVKEFKVVISNPSMLQITASFGIVLDVARTEIPGKVHLNYKDANGADTALDLTGSVIGTTQSQAWDHSLTPSEVTELQSGSVEIFFEIETSKGVGNTFVEADFGGAFPDPFIEFIITRYNIEVTDTPSVVSGPQVSLQLPP